MLTKFPSGKVNVAKNALFLSYELKHKVRLSNRVCGVFQFRFCFVFIKLYILVQQKVWTL